MDKQIRYRNDINKCGLSYQETKRLNQLFLEGKSSQEIKTLVFEENILQQKSFDMQRRMWNEITLRLSNLDEEAKKIIHEEDIQSSKAMVLYSIMKVDKLFHEFSRAVYLDKLLIFQNEITKKETLHFIEHQTGTDDRASKWSEETMRKLANNYLRVMIDAGFLDSNYQIRRVVFSPKTERYLKSKAYKPASEVVLGGLL